MKKTILERQSSDHDAMAQVDSVLSQTGEALRSGDWSASVEHEYTDDGKTVLNRTITIEHKPPDKDG